MTQRDAGTSTRDAGEPGRRAAGMREREPGGWAGRAVVVVALTLASLAEPAGAIPAPRRFSGTLEGPRWESGAAVTSGDVWIRCARDGGLRCDVRALWATTCGDTGGKLRGVVGGAWLTVEDVQCCQGGRCEGCVADPGQAGAPTTDGGGQVALMTAAGPGALIEVRLTGVLAPPPEWQRTSWALTAVQTRHPLLVGDDADTTWHIHVSTPDGATSSVSAEVSGRLEVEGGGWVPDGDRWTATGGDIDLWLREDAPPVIHGGPFLAIGARVNSPYEARGRLGYEIAAPSWLLYALAVETDFQTRALIVPTVEAALPFLLLIPSLGLGVGAPVWLDGDGVRAGVRIQTSVAFPFLSVVIPVDIYPDRPTTADDFWHIAVLLQGSL